MCDDDCRRNTCNTQEIWRSICPTGLSDDEEDESDGMNAELIATLQEIYYSDVEEAVEGKFKALETKPEDNERMKKHGWVYRVKF